MTIETKRQRRSVVVSMGWRRGKTPIGKLPAVSTACGAGLRPPSVVWPEAQRHGVADVLEVVRVVLDEGVVDGQAREVREELRRDLQHHAGAPVRIEHA